MTEKEKMLRQMLYDANNDTDLIEERKVAKDLCYDFNHLRPSNTSEQKKIMRQLLGKTAGDSFCIVAPFWCDYGYNIEIGENFFANHNTVILDCAKVKFGNNVFIAPNCGFHTAGHPIDAERRNQGLEYAYPITVGDNVWIGAGVQVMPGVTIGSNVVIGGGSNSDISLLHNWRICNMDWSPKLGEWFFDAGVGANVNGHRGLTCFGVMGMARLGLKFRKVTLSLSLD